MPMKNSFPLCGQRAHFWIKSDRLEELIAMLQTDCNMLELSGLLAPSIDRSFLRNRLVGSETRFPEKMLIYRRNFLRLADKAVREYSNVKSAALSIIDKQKAHNGYGLGRIRPRAGYGGKTCSSFTGRSGSVDHAPEVSHARSAKARSDP